MFHMSGVLPLLCNGRLLCVLSMLVGFMEHLMLMHGVILQAGLLVVRLTGHRLLLGLGMVVGVVGYVLIHNSFSPLSRSACRL
jgi:hypothetical protein